MGCDDGDSGNGSALSQAPTSDVLESTTTSTRPTTTTTIDAPDLDGADLLNLSEGVLVVGVDGAIERQTAPWQLIDGDSSPVTMATGPDNEVTITLQLPSESTFDAFAVVDPGPLSGNSALYGRVRISGSATGPDTGFALLAEIDLSSLTGDHGEIVGASAEPTAVRWIRVEIDGVAPSAAETGDRTRFVLSEIIGTGEQSDRADSRAFTGSWNLRLLNRPDSVGDSLQMTQSGSLVSGCLAEFELRGVVNGPVATTTLHDPRSGRSGAAILVADAGTLRMATITFDSGRFEARSAHESTDETRPCTPPATAQTVCEAPLHIGFDHDSAEIRRESDQLLRDIHRVLEDQGVDSLVVIGHTSTEGTTEHNLDLSQRRAESVAARLVELGFPATGISTEGRGESEPIIDPDDSEAGRSINRRVELDCG